MPWHIAKSDSCPTSKPYAVIKDADSEVVACHESEEKARRHMAALYANEGKAVMSTDTRNALPDSAFACPEKRLYPHHHADGSLDLVHLRAALSRIGDPNNDQCGKAHLEAHAKAEGMGDRKALLPVKAQALDDDEMEGWFGGKLARRLLAIPFGGPIQSAMSPRGVDLDGEWFSERTDIYGSYPVLRQERERPVDFHHGLDPTGMMGGTIIGKSILDPDPDEDGWWVDVWLKAGEKRLALIKRLAQRGAQLFGSSQAIHKKADRSTGEILEWPFYIETLSTSPQNTYSVLRPAKAVADLDSASFGVSDDLRVFLTDLDKLGTELPLNWDGLRRDAGDEVAKAGRVLSARNERALRDALALLSKHLDEMAGVPTDQPAEGDNP